MKNYYKHSGIQFDKFENAYFELDVDMVCLRALYVVDDNIFNTSVNVDKPNYFLPEGRFENTTGLTQIDQTEFNLVWDRSMLPHAQDWSRIKSKLTPGAAVEASIVCFYPQGAILTLGLQFYALADYNRCKSILGIDKMYPGHKLTLNVDEFDDVNMWIILS